MRTKIVFQVRLNDGTIKNYPSGDDSAYNKELLTDALKPQAIFKLKK